jgi:hypothetical protein
MIPPCVGAWILAHEGRATSAAAAWTTVGVGAIVVGYIVGRRFVPSPIVPQLQLGPRQGRHYVTAIVLVVSTLTLLHFTLGGIPLLSSRIEVSRFNFTSSGLFGLPGRMYLYGAPIAAGVALARSRALGIAWYNDRLTLLALSVLVVSRLLSGFKSGLLEVLIVLLVVAILTRGPMRSMVRILRQYFLPIIGAVIAGFLVATLYSSYYHSPGRSLSESLLSRATTVSAEPRVLTLERRLRILNVSSFDLDATYFAHEYAGIGSSGGYAFSRLVAASMLHINPEGSDHAPPVTYGGFPELAFDFNITLALIAMLALGASLAGIEATACQRSFNHYILCLTAVLAIYDYVVKGGLIYILINRGIVAAMLVGVGSVAQLTARSPGRTVLTAYGAVARQRAMQEPSAPRT